MNSADIYRRTIAVITILTCVNSFMQSQNNLSQLFDVSLPAILKIETFDEIGMPLMSGTGFFINSKGKGVSNLHVFRGAYKSQVTTPSGESYLIDSIWFKNDSLDLVTFMVKKEPNKVFPFLNIDKNVPKIGEEVFVIGNPIGLDFSVSNGIISSVRTLNGFGQIIQTSTPISAGNSGSPLLNMNGLVVGVISFTLAAGQNLNFAISLIDKKLSEDFKILDIKKISEINGKDNPEWITDAFGIVRGYHAAMCENWRFNVDYKRKMTVYPDFKWDVNIISGARRVQLESHVQGYHEGEIVGTTTMLVVNKNLTYIISFGVDLTNKQLSNYPLIIVSRITNGEVTYLINNLVDKTKLNSPENRYLEQVGHEKIKLLVEDKMYVRQIFLEDKFDQLNFKGETYYLNTYEYK